MAGPAVGRHGCVTAGMTGSAGRCFMRPGQRESGRIVIEGRGSPRGLGMAFQAVSVELIGCVVRIRGLVVIILMACPAILGRSRVPVVRMAGDAGSGFMGSSQGKRCRIVVECRGGPCGLGMAFQAVAVELVGHVVRIGGAVKIR